MSQRKSYSIHTAGPADMEDVSKLLVAYCDSLHLDVTMNAECASPASFYQVILLVRALDGSPMACACLRVLHALSACELKRLYVCPDARRTGLARALINKALSEATNLGCKSVVLDSHPSMKQAIALYHSLGFQPTDPYIESDYSFASELLYFQRNLV